MNIYKEYKTNICISREIHRLLKGMKKGNESFNDVLEKVLIKEGYL